MEALQQPRSKGATHFDRRTDHGFGYLVHLHKRESIAVHTGPTHGLIERIPKTHRYQLTKFGFRRRRFLYPHLLQNSAAREGGAGAVDRSYGLG